jgi:Outer membrane protein beta-barrel domain
MAVVVWVLSGLSNQLARSVPTIYSLAKSIHTRAYPYVNTFRRRVSNRNTSGELANKHLAKVAFRGCLHCQEQFISHIQNQQRMKKVQILLCFTLLSIIGTRATAQTALFEFGLEGGTGIAYIRNNQINTKSISAYSSGFMMQFRTGKKLSFRTGLMYEQKGYAFDVNFTEDNGRFQNTALQTIKKVYVTCPVVMRTTFGNETAKLKFFTNAGLYFGYGAGVISKLSYVKDGVTQVPERYNYDTPLYSNELGFTIGVGGTWYISRRLMLSLEANSRFGLITFYQGYSNPFNTVSLNNSQNTSFNLQLGIAYRFWDIPTTQ